VKVGNSVEEIEGVRVGLEVICLTVGLKVIRTVGFKVGLLVGLKVDLKEGFVEGTTFVAFEVERKVISTTKIIEIIIIRRRVFLD